MSRAQTLDPARPTIQHFSSAYDVCELRVRPADTEGVRINNATYRRLQARSEQRTTWRPVFARIPGHSIHFELIPDESVPLEFVEMPFRVVEDLDIEPVPSHETVLIAKPRHGVKLIRLSRLGNTSIN